MTDDPLLRNSNRCAHDAARATVRYFDALDAWLSCKSASDYSRLRGEMDQAEKVLRRAAARYADVDKRAQLEATA